MYMWHFSLSCVWLLFSSSRLFSSHPADHEDRQWPTLLHFAAEFNLRQVCDEVLLCPGMIHAACTKNSEGLLPCQLAERKGFYALQKRLLQYVKDTSKWKPDPWSHSNSCPTGQGRVLFMVTSLWHRIINYIMYWIMNYTLSLSLSLSLSLQMFFAWVS